MAFSALLPRAAMSITIVTSPQMTPSFSLSFSRFPGPSGGTSHLLPEPIPPQLPSTCSPGGSRRTAPGVSPVLGPFLSWRGSGFPGCGVAQMQ